MLAVTVPPSTKEDGLRFRDGLFSPLLLIREETLCEEKEMEKKRTRKLVLDHPVPR